MYNPLITPSDLKVLIKEGKLFCVHAGSGEQARNSYEASHIRGALYLDLDSDLSDVGLDPAQGGRHPLPEPKEFGALLGRIGVTPQSHVVVYDENCGANAAARFWWMMKAQGHEKVQVLDGGLQAAKAEGIPFDNEVVNREPTIPYPADQWKLPLASINDVEKSVSDSDSIVIDVRQAFRYNGESEPIDLIAGHILGAINIPLGENLVEDGTFLSPEELRAKYELVINGKDVTIHCGSGVTACHTILALSAAGFDIPKLYVGSWSEWSRNNKPIATSN